MLSRKFRLREDKEGRRAKGGERRKWLLICFDFFLWMPGSMKTKINLKVRGYLEMSAKRKVQIPVQAR